MSAKRDEAINVLNGAVPQGAVYKSNQGGPPYMNKFYELTWTNHTVLMADYVAGGIMTACNGFVNWYALRLGIKGISNWFLLWQSLQGIQKGEAWVPATATGAKPKPGDILKHRINHVDVAIGFNGNILRRVGAGQGDGTIYSTHPRPRDPNSRAMEYDCLKRVDGTGPYNWQNLEGWLDIDLFFGTATTATDVVPDWLVGWWRVAWRGMIYFYYFDQNHQVKWTQTQPLSTAFPPLLADDTGDFTIDNFSVVTLRWRTTQSVETLRPKYLSSGNEMTGKCNGTDPLTATKI